jgi:hypothetical protein
MKNKRQKAEEAKRYLKKILEWANEGVADHANPPWAFYNYMKLKEAIECTLKSLASVRYINLEGLQGSDKHPENALRLVVDSIPQDTSQPHPDILEVPLPM